MSQTTILTHRSVKVQNAAAGHPASKTGMISGDSFGLVRAYPIAAFAVAGLVVAGILFAARAPLWHQAFAVVSIVGGVPLILSTLRNMLSGRFNVDTIASLAIAGALIEGQFVAGALVVLMQSGGEALEDYGLRRANRSLENLLKRAPSLAHRREGDSSVDVAAGDVRVGDILFIRPGDIIPADAVVIEGHGSVDEAALTGEPVPLSKGAGDRVYSGTINLNGSYIVRTINTAAQSKYELIVRMVQNAQGEKAPINRLADRYAPFFTLFTILVAGGTLAWTQESTRALSVLVVATPCPLIIATPLAVISAVNRAASLNIIVKSGAAVESAGRVDTVVFDKTGTLTGGQPSLDHVVLIGVGPDISTEERGLRERQIIGLAAGVEMLSSHPVATAVVNGARARFIDIVAATGMTETPGKGVLGSVMGVSTAVGSAGFISSEGIPIPPGALRLREDLATQGTTVAYVALDGRVAGLFAFADKIRPEAHDLIEELKTLGIRHTIMLTGDAEETAQTVASSLGIPEVRARLRPEDKLHAVTELSAERAVLMVGDGINDAPALAAATVGIAMGSFGTGVATDAADMVITVDNVARVADAIKIGRRMMRVAEQGILFGIGASVLLMFCATLGWISPPVGALCQEAVDLAAVLNAFRAR